MKTIITTVLLITMLPIMCQQRQMSLDVTFSGIPKRMTVAIQEVFTILIFMIRTIKK